jgi:16S rRNA (cytidine1402-2'-O)-methyltransferase
MNIHKRGGKLLICPTPLGNLQDITLRCLAALRSADVIIAEDTRVTKTLLRAYEIATPMRSFHERNAESRLRELRELLNEGKTVAVVSDAGMPGVSDPGSQFVRAARIAGLQVEVLPGPSVVPAALLLSGFDVSRFRFDGFAPRKAGERRLYFQGIESERAAVVLFEAPSRIEALLRTAAAALPNRRFFVLREYTKKFEEHMLGTARELLERLKTPARGEFTLVIEGSKETAPSTKGDITSAVDFLVRAGVSVKDATEAVRRASGAPRNEVYRLALTAKRK